LAKFLVTLFLLAVLISAIGIWGFETLPGYFYHTLFFLFISTAGLYRFLLRTKQQRPDFFVQLYLATMTIKLIAYGAYMFFIIRNQPDQKVPNVAFFMAVYFLFTVTEIGFLYRHVNK
jgi:hypothetical protein